MIGLRFFENYGCPSRSEPAPGGVPTKNVNADADGLIVSSAYRFFASRLAPRFDFLQSFMKVLMTDMAF